MTHTAQCALDSTAILTFAFQGLSSWYWEFFFFNIRIESKGNRICFYICNSLEHHFSEEKDLNPPGYSGAKVFLD